jgi:hypothetical protein
MEVENNVVAAEIEEAPVEQPEFMQRSLQVLAVFGCDASFFERYSIDPIVFDSLPEEYKLEIIQQYLPQENQRQLQL